MLKAACTLFLLMDLDTIASADMTGVIVLAPEYSQQLISRHSACSLHYKLHQFLVFTLSRSQNACQPVVLSQHQVSVCL